MPEIILSAYLEKVGLSLPQLDILDPVERLKKLYEAHVLTFPYSNIKLRRASWEHPLKRQIEFEDYKSVFFEAQGGYCFQLALLLKDILEKMDYQVEACEARILMGEEVNAKKVLESPPTHLVLKVTIDGKTYFLDPGLGSQSPRWPILVRDKDESILQPNDELRFYHLEKENLHVLERRTEQGWFRLIQTDLQAITKDHIEFNLLKTVHHLPLVDIRDGKMVIGRMMPQGRCSLLWLASTGKLKFIEKTGSESKEDILTSYESAAQLVEKKFGITLSPQELKKWCTSNVKDGFLFFKTKEAWTVDFPLDERTRKAMEANLVSQDLKDSSLVAHPSSIKPRQSLAVQPVLPRHMECLYQHIESINHKAVHLRTRGYGEEATCAENLADFLKQKSMDFFSNRLQQQREYFPTFFRECNEQILRADEDWAKIHRGYKQILMNILQSLTGIGVILGLAQWCSTGRYALFTVKTNSTKLLESARDDLEQVEKSFHTMTR